MLERIDYHLNRLITSWLPRDYVMVTSWLCRENVARHQHIISMLRQSLASASYVSLLCQPLVTLGGNPTTNIERHTAPLNKLHQTTPQTHQISGLNRHIE